MGSGASQVGHAPGLGSPAWPLSLWLPLRGPWEAGRPLGPSADLGSGWASSPQTFLSPRPCCDVCGGSVGGWGGVGRARHGLRFLAACRSDAIRSLCPRAGRQLPPAPLLAAEDGASTWCTNLRKGPRAWEPLLRLGGSSAHLHPLPRGGEVSSQGVLTDAGCWSLSASGPERSLASQDP